MISAETVDDKGAALLFCKFAKIKSWIFEKYEITKLEVLGFNSFVIPDFLLLFLSHWPIVYMFSYVNSLSHVVPYKGKHLLFCQNF